MPDRNPDVGAEGFPRTPGAFTALCTTRLFKEPDELRKVTVIGPWGVFIYSVYEGKDAPSLAGEHFLTTSDAVKDLLECIDEQAQHVSDCDCEIHDGYYMEVEHHAR